MPDNNIYAIYSFSRIFLSQKLKAKSSELHNILKSLQCFKITSDFTSGPDLLCDVITIHIQPKPFLIHVYSYPGKYIHMYLQWQKCKRSKKAQNSSGCIAYLEKSFSRIKLNICYCCCHPSAAPCSWSPQWIIRSVYLILEP